MKLTETSERFGRVEVRVLPTGGGPKKINGVWTMTFSCRVRWYVVGIRVPHWFVRWFGRWVA